MRLLIVLLAVAAPLSAQPASDWEHNFGGYWKNLFTASRTIVNRERFGDLLGRLRLTYDGRYKDWFQVQVAYDNEAHFGNLIRQPEFTLVRDRQAAAWLDLHAVVAEGEHAYWDTSLYRGSVTLRKGGLGITLGRQRIGWGTARFWSPADAFNPLSPLQLEPEERQGVDGAYLEWNFSGNWTCAAAVLPQNRFSDGTVAVRLATTARSWDVAAFFGRFERDWMGGMEAAGQWGGAGLRAEATYRKRDPSRPENDAFRFTAGADYAFANTLYVVGEYFYNQGQPALGPGFSPASLLRFTTEIFTLNRHFLSGGAGYDVTPLFRVEAYAVVDLAGAGVFFQPQALYNLTPNTDLRAGAQLFASRPGGDFEPLSNLFFVEAVVHF